MDESYNWLRGSPRADGNSVVISDSDEDIDNVGKEQFLVIESSGSSNNISRNITPETSLPSNGDRIKKFIPDYSDNEDQNDASCSDSNEDDPDYSNSSDGSEKIITAQSKKTKKKSKTLDVTMNSINTMEISNISLNDESDNNNTVDEYGSTSSTSTHTPSEGRNVQQSKQSSNLNTDNKNSSEPEEIAVTLAKKEIGVGNIDPMVAQKRALLICKMEHLQNQLSKTKLLLDTGNIDLLPDKGERLRQSIMAQEKEIEEIAIELENTPLTQQDKDVQFVKKDLITHKLTYTSDLDSEHDINSIPTKLKTSLEMKELGARAQATLNKELALTVDRIQDLHGSLLARPTEEQRADDPQGLKVQLMPHQQHALAWLMWREQQRPPGGVLADDMGLGKTLTMISLIIAAKKSKSTEDSSDEEWTNYKTALKHKGGTLVVCPASLLSQWENEILNRCKRGLLSIEVYHGTNRETVPKRLARNDVVITTYNILSREYKTKSTTYRIHWDRVILDEAHVVRNHKSQASEAVCGLVANKRWALSGTPIQNKEMDLYSILKFLKCTPFDDLRVWKRWVDNKDHSGRQRLATVMDTLMLRRTKQELQDKGELECLPDKKIEEIIVELDEQEQLVYEKVLIYSRTLFAQFLSQRAEKDHMDDLASGAYDKPAFLSNPNKNTQFTKAQNKLLSLHADVKAHEILVLLLRLRQICVHPTLIHSMLDQEDMMESGIMDMQNIDSNILLQMNNITLQESDDNKNENDQEIGIDHRVTTNLLTSKNPVFKAERISSKMKVVLSKVEEILEKNDKLIIVSQWSSMLKIVASYLSSIRGATFSMFTGNVAIKDRQGVMDSFNSPNRDPRILLLSLTAGGVGLNLVGGNHLLLIDIHWNPQLEVQAQDRIYRFGQKKNVSIYKFICKDTIEERIKQLQEKKMEIAQNVLSGGKTSVASKLTLNDLKSLFGL
ncbi:transcription termination factor 2-like isoform X1 [Hylaeus anthracinus]|uniref:transcription termination factor 2-like isoform X1 n=1 Tax=Hylaeus anthracinus TaxID=313031 RepID=UPI0023B9C095|nr:transcription termination factor 2-like isoform X1 [Hylaeus anthracinus]XP_053997671.1 transcription termination factor 2-like isoform X1 [Hylaeus anthracinus]